MFKNREGYPGPTAGDAIKEADRPPEAVPWLIKTYHEIAALLGYEIDGTIQIRDRKTKRNWR